MAKYTTDKESDSLRKALIDFIKSDIENDQDKERNYRKNLSFRAIANDVTGSLGIWGIKQQ